MQNIFLTDTLKKLKNHKPQSIKYKAFVGTDGYIDFIQRPVKAHTANGTEYFATITEFAAHIDKAAGKSAQIELISQEVKLGGNAPIMAECLGTLGLKTTCLGNFGKDGIHPLFQLRHENVELLSVGDSAVTNALEFNDGKIILSEVGPFKNQDWNYIKSKLGLQFIISAMQSCNLIALVDWCNLPHATDIWKGILTEVLPIIQSSEMFFFFDIADPTRRSDEEIKEALQVMSEYSAFGKVTLGLNENETEKMYTCLNRINKTVAEDISLIEKGIYIFKQFKVDNLLIHPTDRSISINSTGVSELKGRLVKTPKISTGGGDNFNAGYCLGHLMGMDLENSMILGMATSGAYVQNGKSPNYDILLHYIENWINKL